jgi:hypothetical protein
MLSVSTYSSMDRINLVMNEVASELQLKVRSRPLDLTSPLQSYHRELCFNVSLACITRRFADANRQERRIEELTALLETERAEHAHRESELIRANAELLQKVEELSSTVSRLQSEVLANTRSKNDSLVAKMTSPRPVASSAASQDLRSPALTSGSLLGNASSRTPPPASATDVLAAIDESVDSMKGAADRDLEQHKHRLLSKVRPGAQESQGALQARRASSPPRVAQARTSPDSAYMSVTPPPTANTKDDARSQDPIPAHRDEPQATAHPPEAVEQGRRASVQSSVNGGRAGGGHRSVFDKPTVSSMQHAAHASATEHPIQRRRESHSTMAPAARVHPAPVSAPSAAAAPVARSATGYAARAAASGRNGTAASHITVPSTTAQFVPPQLEEPRAAQHTLHQPTFASAAGSASLPASGTGLTRPDIRAAPYEERPAARALLPALDPAPLSVGSTSDVPVTELPAGEITRTHPWPWPIAAAPGPRLQAQPVEGSTTHEHLGVAASSLPSVPSVALQHSTPHNTSAVASLPTMSAVEFFALLRTRVPGDSLALLMAALSDFNQRRVDKAALMDTARVALSDAGHGLDLFSAFQQFMSRG